MLTSNFKEFETILFKININFLAFCQINKSMSIQIITVSYNVVVQGMRIFNGATVRFSIAGLYKETDWTTSSQKETVSETAKTLALG